MHAVPSEIIIDGLRYRLVPVIAEDEPKGRPPLPLTEREVEVARAVASGLVNKEIAARFDISEHTVSTHLRRIFSKLGVDTRAEMVGRVSPYL